MDKKGQSALEYLMTYGWALVVIVIVIAALVFLINPSQIGAEGCTGFSKLPIKNFKASTTNFKFIVTNETGKLAKDVNVTYQGKRGGSTTTLEGDYVGNVAANAEKEFTYDAFTGGTVGDVYSLDFNISYRDNDGYDRNATATCKGTI